jgi:signal transduction histidine kinase
VNRSVRARMTLLYGGLFTTISMAVLFGALILQGWAATAALGGRGGRTCSGPECDGPPPAQPPDDVRESVLTSQRLILLAAVAVIAVLAFVVCWWLTGRLLRPLHRITAAAQRLSLSTLHERLALTGPDDELRRLADTFDAMLDRLERAVDSQRRFIANASHELRTPLAVQRTALEVGLADPSPERVRLIRAELLRNTRRSERLIDGLLQLAKGERGPDAAVLVDLARVVADVVDQHRGEAGVTVAVSVRPATVLGDEVMLSRLVENLVQNAIRYNVPDGTVRVELTGDGALVVVNTGPVVPPERAGELLEPLRRLDTDRTGTHDGAGLGLSIVAAIARAHAGTVTVLANPGGGLTVRVGLPVQPLPDFSSQPS